MKIVDLPGGRVSLEFAPLERDAVLTALRERCGAYHLRGEYELVTERGDRLVYMDEWDEPCLISTEPAGDVLLRDLAEGHGARKKIRRSTRKIDSAQPLGHS